MQFSRRLPPLADFSGKRVLVTGANSGLGFMTASTFAAQKATVLVACRDFQKAEMTAQKILQLHPSAKLEPIVVNLASFDSIISCANSLKSQNKTLNVLINNAGVFSQQYRTTEEGFEEIMGINHLGTFLLTSHLFSTLEPSARIINVASDAYRIAKLDVGNMCFTPKDFNQGTAYANSKLANILFALEFERRSNSSTKKIVMNAMNPGAVKSSIFKDFPPLVQWGIGLFCSDGTQAASSLVYLAGDSQLESVSGKYFDKRGRMKEIIPFYKKKYVQPDVLEDFWENSERLTNRKFFDK